MSASRPRDHSGARLAAAGFDRRRVSHGKWVYTDFVPDPIRTRDLPPPCRPPDDGCARQRRPLGRGDPAAVWDLLVPHELAIVIPTLGRPQQLARALGHLERQSGQLGRFEVVVVHGERGCGSGDRARSVGGPLRLRRLTSSDTSASAQRNAGWRSVSAPLVLFLDDDVLASPDLVAAHLRAHARRPESEVGVLGLVRWAPKPRPTAFMQWLEQGIQFDFRGLQPGADAAWWRFYTANASVKRRPARAGRRL